jgi:hypothetical protein
MSQASIDLLFAPAKPNNPFEIAKRTLIAQLARLPVPQIDVTPQVEQIEGVRTFMEGVAKLTDQLFASVGVELKVNSTTHVDLRLWQGVVSDAIDFDLTHVVTRVAESLRNEYDAVDARRAVEG